VDIVRNAWTSALDPRLTADDRARGQTSHSKMIIDACKPFAWKDSYPATSSLSLDEKRYIEERWMNALRWPPAPL
jgi:4-hydroxy-3-polyprenylbenzoate decarboxylase